MSSTPDAETDVLVVGAGPVGLSLAIDLARRGVAAQIIDTLAEPTQESCAIVVHSRTLDHFEALGVLDDILDRSMKSTGMEMHSPATSVCLADIVKGETVDSIPRCASSLGRELSPSLPSWVSACRPEGSMCPTRDRHVAAREPTDE